MPSEKIIYTIELPEGASLDKTVFVDKLKALLVDDQLHFREPKEQDRSELKPLACGRAESGTVLSVEILLDHDKIVPPLPEKLRSTPVDHPLYIGEGKRYADQEACDADKEAFTAEFMVRKAKVEAFEDATKGVMSAHVATLGTIFKMDSSVFFGVTVDTDGIMQTNER